MRFLPLSIAPISYHDIGEWQVESDAFLRQGREYAVLGQLDGLQDGGGLATEQGVARRQIEQSLGSIGQRTMEGCGGFPAGLLFLARELAATDGLPTFLPFLDAPVERVRMCDSVLHSKSSGLAQRRSSVPGTWIRSV